MFDLIENFHISLVFWPALLILVLTPFLGRFFCGWLCPLGTTLDAASHILKSPPTTKSAKWNKLRPLKFGLLFGTIVLALFSVNTWGYIDPLSLFNRALTVVIYPLATLFINAALAGIGAIPFLATPTYAVYDWFKFVIMPESQAHTQQLFWIAVLFGGILGLEKVSRRFWCRYICPAGALLGFLSQFRIFERIVNTSCNECGKCVRECKMDAIPSAQIPETSKVECIECFSCATNCPPKLNAIQYRFRLKPYHTKVDYSRRHFLETTFGSFVALGLLSIGLPNKTAGAKTIRPPGSLPEPEFQDNCIRCLECIRICQSNGACLQPDGIHTSILELWAPVAVMRTGYCEYNCNLCGQVCPTDAILPLSLEQKQKTPMGLAYFDKDLCIPYAKNEDCIVCEEHCPTPEKAIKLDEKDTVLPDGTVKRVKYPYMVREKCIGCGICEMKCPLPGEPGIFVTIENQVRLTKSDISQA
ncbi:4Fe-4S binding protein [Candidatus Neomarinimicrobiota bacterium]